MKKNFNMLDQKDENEVVFFIRKDFSSFSFLQFIGLLIALFVLSFGSCYPNINLGNLLGGIFSVIFIWLLVDRNRIWGYYIDYKVYKCYRKGEPLIASNNSTLNAPYRSLEIKWSQVQKIFLQEKKLIIVINISGYDKEYQLDLNYTEERPEKIYSILNKFFMSSMNSKIN